MAYPGNSGLSVQAQERVITAFKQVLNNLQAGQREEAMIGLEFVLRLDPKFTPAVNLQRQLASSSKEIDLGDIIAQLQAPTTEAINTLLIEAVDDFNSREFLAAKEKVEKVLIDLPGHQEARELRDQIDKALKVEGQVGQFLVQAREALANGDPQEAANFVMMAQALDPHHTGIASTLKEIDETGGLAFAQDHPEAPKQPEATQPPDAPQQPEAPPPEPEPPSVSPTQETVVSESPPSETSAPVDEPAAADDDEEEDAFAVEFDTEDPFADLIAPEQDDASASDAPAFGAGPADDVSFPPMDDTADLFAAPADVAGESAESAPADTEGTTGGDDDSAIADRIQELIENGQAAYDRRDEPQAIALWSRVFLIKPNHPEAGHLIVQAKKRFAESESRVNELLGKARDAFDAGDFDAAGLLVSEALEVRPNHLGVTLLKEELEREGGAPVPGTRPDTAATKPEAAEPKSPDLPELDDDLFAEASDLGDEDDEPAVAGTSFDDELFADDDDDFIDFEQLSLFDRLKSKLPMRTLAIAAVALVVVLAGVWIGGTILSSEPEVDDAAAVNEVLLEADRLYKEHKVEEALHLLREFPTAGLSKQRIDMRIAKYEESLAPPTPTPVPEHAARAQRLLDQGLWWAAFKAAGEGLAAYPDDAGLTELRRLVLEIEPEAASLDSALKTEDYRTAVSITDDLLLQYPGQGDLQVVLERSLFNAALAESRAYNLTGAENHLLRLLELKPEDEEAVRFLEFVQKYKVRAADMRLEIFIRSLDER